MKQFFGKVFSFIQHIQYELAIFFFLLIRGLPTADFSSIFGWQCMSYVLNYEYGFSSRLLIGSLLRLIHPDFISAKDTAIFVNLTVIFDCLILAIALGAFLRTAHKRGQFLFAAVPVVMYLAYPLNFSIYFSAAGHAGKLEIFLLPLMLLSAWLLLNTQPGTKQTIAISAISVVAMLIYQNYVFLCFPLILALIIWNLFEYGWNKKNILHSLIICFITGGAFLYLQLIAKLNASDASALTAELQSRTDMYIGYDAVYYEYFASFSDFFVDLMLGRYDYQFQTLFMDLLISAPVIIINLYIWIKAFRGCADKSEKWTLILLQLSSAAFLPTYIITCDWARWSIWYVLFQTAVILLLWFKEFRPMVRALEAVSELVCKYKAIAAMVVIYLLSLTSNSVTEIFVITKTIHNHFFG